MSDDRGAAFFAGVVYSGGAALLAGILVFSMFPSAAVSSVPVRYPELPDSPRCPDLSVPPPPGIDPPACDGDDGGRGWRLGHMGDRARDCLKPGGGRPWCR